MISHQGANWKTNLIRKVWYTRKNSLIIKSRCMNQICVTQLSFDTIVDCWICCVFIVKPFISYINFSLVCALQSPCRLRINPHILHLVFTLWQVYLHKTSKYRSNIKQVYMMLYVSVQTLTESYKVAHLLYFKHPSWIFHSKMHSPFESVFILLVFYIQMAACGLRPQASKSTVFSVWNGFLPRL